MRRRVNQHTGSVVRVSLSDPITTNSLKAGKVGEAWDGHILWVDRPVTENCLLTIMTVKSHTYLHHWQRLWSEDTGNEVILREPPNWLSLSLKPNPLFAQKTHYLHSPGLHAEVRLIFHKTLSCLWHPVIPFLSTVMKYIPFLRKSLFVWRWRIQVSLSNFPKIFTETFSSVQATRTSNVLHDAFFTLSDSRLLRRCHRVAAAT